MSDGRFDLFCRLCRIVSPLSSAERVAAALPPGDLWPAMIALADHHLVLSELHIAIARHGLRDRVPQSANEMLEACFDVVVGRNADLREQAHEITKALAEEAIAVVWLKGAVYLTEPDWARSGRVMTDLDFWIPDVDGQRTALVRLEREGYHIYSGNNEDRWLKSHHYSPRFRWDKPAQIEIHRHVVRPDLAPLLPDAVAQGRIDWRQWRGQRIGQLALVDRIMHSLVQCTVMSTPAMGRAQPRLMKFVDLARLVGLAGGTALPGELVERIGRSRWRKQMARFLTFAQREFGIANPFGDDPWYVDRLEIATRRGQLPLHMRLGNAVAMRKRRLLGR